MNLIENVAAIKNQKLVVIDVCFKRLKPVKRKDNKCICRAGQAGLGKQCGALI